MEKPTIVLCQADGAGWGMYKNKLPRAKAGELLTSGAGTEDSRRGNYLVLHVLVQLDIKHRRQ
jgi:hypothetical protein